jgi:hypothetical protein
MPGRPPLLKSCYVWAGEERVTLLRRIACVSEFVLATALFGSAVLGISAAFLPTAPDDPVGDGPMYVALGGVLLLPIAVGFALAGAALLKNWRPQWAFQTPQRASA